MSHAFFDIWNFFFFYIENHFFQCSGMYNEIFQGGGGFTSSPGGIYPPPFLNNFIRNLFLNFLIWPLKVKPFNTKNKGYQKPGKGAQRAPTLNQGGGYVLALPPSTVRFCVQVYINPSRIKVQFSQYNCP